MTGAEHAEHFDEFEASTVFADDQAPVKPKAEIRPM